MIHDAQVEVTCDGEDCNASIHVQPPYVYANLSGAGGHYDTDDSTLEKLIAAEGWKVQDGKHLCEACGGDGD